MSGYFLSALLLILVVVLEHGSSSVLNYTDRLDGDTYTTANVSANVSKDIRKEAMDLWKIRR